MLRERLAGQDGFGLVELMIAITVMAIGIAAIVTGFSSGILAVSRASQTSTAGTLADKQMETYRAIPYNSIVTTPLAASDTTYSNDAALASPLFPLTTTLSSWPAAQYNGSFCGSTTMSAGSSIGATSIAVTGSGASSLVVGVPITVGPQTGASASTAEAVTVTAVSGTTLTVSPALAKAHGSGSAVAPVTCVPIRSVVTGPDGRQYRIDSFVTWYCAAGIYTQGTPYSQTSPGCTVDGTGTGTAQARAVKQVTVVVRNTGSPPTKTYIRETSTFDQAT